MSTTSCVYPIHARCTHYIYQPLSSRKQLQMLQMIFIYPVPRVVVSTTLVCIGYTQDVLTKTPAQMMTSSYHERITQHFLVLDTRLHLL